VVSQPNRRLEMVSPIIGNDWKYKNESKCSCTGGRLRRARTQLEAIGDRLDLTLIDQSDAFFFGFSKLDVMFGGKPAETVQMAYRQINKPGVHFRQETSILIDPEKRRVTTDQGAYEADALVVALGAGYDLGATPALLEGGNEFYSLAGPERLRELLPTFSKGRAIVVVTSAPFKCPPAPSEAALLLDDFLTRHDVRGDCEISLVMPRITDPTLPGLLQGPAESLRRAQRAWWLKH